MLVEDKDYRFYNGKLSINSENKWIDIELNEYRFISVIAPGANGVTIKAHNDLTKRDVAIKVWKPQDNDRQRYRERFEKEIQKISNIKHPNIVTIFEGRVLESGFCVAVLEYVNGITLREWLKKERSESAYISVCKNILETIIEYQNSGIIHGDLHTGNILIRQNNKISLIDFGSSRFSNASKSRDRECFFIAELTMTLLHNLSGYNENHLAFTIVKNRYNQKLSLKQNILGNCAVNPLLLTQTMLNYIDIVEMLTFIKSFDLADMIDLSDWICKTRYLDITTLTQDIVNYYIADKQVNQFLQILSENIEENTFPQFSDDIDHGDALFQASAFVYYELAKTSKVRLSNPYVSDETDENFIVGNAVQQMNMYLESDDNINYFEVIKEVSNTLRIPIIQIQNAIRATLYYSLKKEADNILSFHYHVNTRISEVFADAKILNEIVRLNEELNAIT